MRSGATNDRCGCGEAAAAALTICSYIYTYLPARGECAFEYNRVDDQRRRGGRVLPSIFTDFQLTDRIEIVK